MDSTIDSFVHIPILIAAAAGLILFILLLLSKIRNTSKVSFVFYLAIGVSIAGLLYTYKNRQIMYLVVTFLLSEFLLIIYAFVLAVSDPKKRAQKKNQKEKEQNSDADAITKEAIEQIKEKYSDIISINRDLVTKAAGFFSSEDAMSAFLQYFDKLLLEKTGADGCAVLLYDEFDDVLAVKSLEGKFPPPYKLPEDLPHKPIRVETNFKFSQFAVSGNIFGDIFTAGKPVNIAEPNAKNSPVFQNEPEEFLKCGPYLFIPMQQDGENIALVCISRAAGQEPFTQD